MEKEQAAKDIAAHIDAIQEIMRSIDLAEHLNIGVFTDSAFVFAIDDAREMSIDIHKSKEGFWYF